MYEKSGKTLDKMLAHYRLLALLTIFAFVFSAFIMITGIRAEGTHPLFLFAIFLSAASWIGMTALCRHSYVVLKTAMGKRIGLLEFLSTNLVVLIFPAVYGKLKKEVASFKMAEHSNNAES
jgi:hypothetical protein